MTWCLLVFCLFCGLIAGLSWWLALDSAGRHEAVAAAVWWTAAALWFGWKAVEGWPRC